MDSVTEEDVDLVPRVDEKLPSRDWNVVGVCWLSLTSEINGRENTLLFNHKKTFRYKGRSSILWILGSKEAKTN